MRILIASLVTLMLLPGMASSTHHKSQASAPIASVAYAEATRPNPLTDCPCQIGPDGVSRDCNGVVCSDNGSAIKTETNSATRLSASPTASSSFGIWVRTLISVIGFFAMS